MERKNFEYISENIELFSKNRRRIAEFILDHFDAAAYMTAAKLAEETGVSESTVVRFAYALGYESYRDFQDMLKETVKLNITPRQRMNIVSERLENRNILRDTLKSDMEKIESTLEQISPEIFQEAAGVLTEAKTVYILGVRSSEALACFAGYYLNLLLENVKIINSRETEDVIEQLLKADERDVVLGISFPRYSRTVYTALDFAKKRNVKVIGLTDSGASPIYGCSDYCLFAKCEMDNFADSLVAPMSVLNALIGEIMLRKKDSVEKTMAELEEIWEAYNVYSTDENRKY